MNTKKLVWPYMVDRISPSVRVALGIVAGYWLLLFVATHIPAHRLVQTVNMWDKAIHWSAYSVLAFLVAWGFALRQGITPKAYGVLFLLLAAYGVADELLQALPFIRRSCELGDWLADVAGVATGLTAYFLISRRFRNWAWVAGNSRR